MNRTVLTVPPDPASYPQFPDWQMALYNCLSQWKQKLENDSRVNTTPVGPLVVGTYTMTNTLAGTDATSNFLATMVTYMQQQGITSPNTSRTSTT